LNCLDVLAQQVVACVATQPWDVPALYDLIRGAYPFHNLSVEAFESILRLISGRFPTGDFRDLRARVVWDRVHNRLAALPGTAQLALVGGGTIPDTGQYPVFLGEGGPRLGEIDEEFVYERRVGESFVLGNSTWRITAIDPHRVIVAKAEGHTAVMPFWRGESAARSPELGEAVGTLSREMVERLDDPQLPGWLERECRLTPEASASLRYFILRQQRLAGAVPDDRTILVESHVDPAGELGLAVLSPFGGRLHHALKLALVGRIRERFGLSPACLHSDNGLLFRLPAMTEPPLDLLENLTSDLAERLIRAELPETALFGLRFRQNASRALLMPRPDPGKRTPLWLQRLRAKDLLQIARQFPDFPILLETMRECLDDDLDLPRLRTLLDAIGRGTVQVVRRAGEAPSPFVSELIFEFTAAHLYEWDDPKRSDRHPAASVVDEDLLAPLLRGDVLEDWLSPQAIGRLENRLRRLGRPPRTADEMAEHLRVLGDLTHSELTGPMEAFLAELAQTGRALVIELPGTQEPARWILTEEQSLYDEAFPASSRSDDESRATIVRRYLRTHALIGLSELTARYTIPPVEAADLLERWADEGRVVRVNDPDAPAADRWAERENLAEMRRVTVAVRRRESLAVAPEVFADFLLRRQHVHPATVGDGAGFVEVVLQQLQGFAAPAASWEKDILPRRVKGYRPAWLDDVLNQGSWLWRAAGSPREDPRVAFFLRDFVGLPGADPAAAELSPDEQALLEVLNRQGASFATDLARRSAIEPSRVRKALATLLKFGLVTNDRFDPLRVGSQATLLALAEASSSRRAGQTMRIRPRRSLSPAPEGRWSRLESTGGDAESTLLAWIAVLIDRYGVLAREVVALEPSAPTWAELAPLLSRSEWRGELRRGYFVEGLSGVQYASAEAAGDLAHLAGSAGHGADPLVLVCSTDPANIYGAGAPLDVELLDGGVARLPRNPGNFLVLRAGRPILIIESHGKRLTGLASASQVDIDSALNLLVSFTGPDRRILKVESYNKAPASEGPVAGHLAGLGFVRDYPGMAYYAGWASS
jgi:ATP-dependent helicase Lhr and Lhr-like helicase